MFFRKAISSPAAKPSENLADWLAAATSDLVPSAQQRVRAEIEAHFAEAVQTNLKNGWSELDANATALTDLGNAQTAAKRFAREYLTKRDVQKLGDFGHPRTGVSLRHVALASILLFGWIALHNDNDLNFRGVGRLYYTGLVEVIMAAALAVLAFRVLSAFWTSPMVVARRTLSLRVILLILSFILATAAIWLMQPTPELLMAGSTGLLAAGLYTFLSLYRLREKLRYAADTDFITFPLANN